MPTLFMCLIGCEVPGRNIEQHDIFFGIGNELKELAPAVKESWPEAIKIHLDAWREVSHVDGYKITVTEKSEQNDVDRTPPFLFFLNLGGYKKDEFEEFHYRMVAIAPDKGEAIRKSKQTAFFRHTGFTGATSHVDDKYGVDVDDVVEIREILHADLLKKYSIEIIKDEFSQAVDEIHLGYFILDKL